MSVLKINQIKLPAYHDENDKTCTFLAKGYGFKMEIKKEQILR